MVIPLAILAVFAVVTGFLGTPAWPWFHAYLNGETVQFSPSALVDKPQLMLMLVSTLVVAAAFFAGWRIYSKVAATGARDKDPLEKSFPALFRLLQNKFYIDEFYEATVIRCNSAFSTCANWLDNVLWSGAVNAVSALTVLCARINRAIDEFGVNGSFDAGCNSLRGAGGFLSWAQNGRIQRYLRVAGLAVSVLMLVLIWEIL